MKTIRPYILLVLLFVLPDVARAADPLPNAEVRVINGRPTIVVDGKALPSTGHVSMVGKKETVRQFQDFCKHRMGIYHVAPPQIPGEQFDTPFWVGDQVSATPIVEPKFDTRYGLPIETLTQADPEAYFLVRFPLIEPSTWRKLHPEEYAVNENGVRLDAPSYASDRYWECASRFATAVVQYYEARPWAFRIIGYANFFRNEGTHVPVIGGWLFDHSAPMQRRWRNLARYAGAHVYSEANDVLLADSSIVALHSVQSGPKRIALPGAYRVWDVIADKLVADRATAIAFTMQAPDTRVFRLEPVR